MTNEEKAREIAESHGICYKCHSKYESDMDSTLECYGSAMEMAEWKDSQPISAETFRACIYMLNNTCYESGTGVDEADIEYTIKQRRLS